MSLEKQTNKSDFLTYGRRRDAEIGRRETAVSIYGPRAQVEGLKFLKSERRGPEYRFRGVKERADDRSKSELIHCYLA